MKPIARCADDECHRPLDALPIDRDGVITCACGLRNGLRLETRRRIEQKQAVQPGLPIPTDAHSHAETP